MKFFRDRLNIVILIAIVIFAGVVRFFFLVKSDNFLGGISIANITNSISLSANIHSLINNWHLVSDLLIRLSLLLYNDPSISPRILMVLLATFSLLPFYKLNRLFFNPKISLTSTLLLAVYPLHLKLSSVTLAQIPFIFFSLWALYYFFKFIMLEKTAVRVRKSSLTRFIKHPKNIKNLIFSCIFLNIITMIRFEGIIFIFILFLFLLFSKHKKFIIFFTIISLLFLFFNLSLSIKYEKDFLEHLIESSVYSRAEINFAHQHGKTFPAFPNTLIEKIISWPSILYFSFSPIISILIVLGLSISFFKKNDLRLFFIGIFVFLCFMYKTFANTIIVQEHYSLIFGVLFIPYAALGIDTLFNSLTYFRWIRKFKVSRIIFHNILYSCLILVIVTSGINTAYRNRPVLPKFVSDIAYWLERNVGNEDINIIMDMDKWQAYFKHIIFLSGLDRDNFLIKPFKIVKGERHVDKKRVLDYLNTKQPKYLVFSPGGLLSEIFPFKKEQQFNVAYGFVFTKEYESGKYIIYSIDKVDEAI